VAADIIGFLHGLGRGARTSATDLRQARHVGIAQHQADIGCAISRPSESTT
jgi:hypothetical protein